MIDGFTGAVAELIGEAARMAPLPEMRGNYYPGLRRVIGDADGAAFGHVERLLEDAAPYIGGGFDMDGFTVIEASFSMVTTPPEALTPPQRAPHFDSTDPNYLAVMLYLGGTEGSGTAFYRQRVTGIEVVNDANLPRFVAAAKAAPAEGYIRGSDAHYEEIGRIEAVPDRLVVYRGALLHSGVIPPDMNFSADPNEGRLTLNIFIKGH